MPLRDGLVTFVVKFVFIFCLQGKKINDKFLLLRGSLVFFVLRKKTGS
jgi:hypothetical protein